jgi:hypothetical protein
VTCTRGQTIPGVGNKWKRTFGTRSVRPILVGRPVLVAVNPIIKYGEEMNVAPFARAWLAVVLWVQHYSLQASCGSSNLYRVGIMYMLIEVYIQTSHTVSKFTRSQRSVRIRLILLQTLYMHMKRHASPRRMCLREGCVTSGPW